MGKSAVLLWIVLILPVVVFAQKVRGYQIPFNPSTYLCMQTKTQIQIDGLGDEKEWDNAPWSTPFVDIEGNAENTPSLETKFKMLWDNDNLYFYAKMEEPHVWATLKNHDDIIFHDDDFEIFIDIDGDTHHYYEMEFNAYNTLWDLLLLRPYRVGGIPNTLFGWNPAGIKHAVHVEGTIDDPSDEDQFWSIEVAIPWKDLREMSQIKSSPKAGEQWRLNFSRVDWDVIAKDGTYTKEKDSTGKHLPEHNWVWSPTGVLNIHIPEMWGIVQFTDQMVGSAQEVVTYSCDEKVKQELWRLYWQQKDHFKATGRYIKKRAKFKKSQNIGDVKVHTSPVGFDMVMKSCESSKSWIIDESGRIRTIQIER